jgi:hypothetical protein
MLGLTEGGTGGGEGGSSSPANNGSTSGGNSSGVGGRLASAQPMAAEPEIGPLVSAESSDEALGEEEDWLLEALLA